MQSLSMQKSGFSAKIYSRLGIARLVPGVISKYQREISGRSDEGKSHECFVANEQLGFTKTNRQGAICMCFNAKTNIGADSSFGGIDNPV